MRELEQEFGYNLMYTDFRQTLQIAMLHEVRLHHGTVYPLGVYLPYITFQKHLQDLQNSRPPLTRTWRSI